MTNGDKGIQKTLLRTRQKTKNQTLILMLLHVKGYQNFQTIIQRKE